MEEMITRESCARIFPRDFLFLVLPKGNMRTTPLFFFAFHILYPTPVFPINPPACCGVFDAIALGGSDLIC